MNHIVQIFENQKITIRPDGYWNATLMCRQFNKQINDFLRLKQTQAYLEALALDLDVSPESLVLAKKGGDVTEAGTWVHEQVALKLAAWLHPKFEVWVYKVIKKLLTQGEVKLKDEIEGLKAALSESEAWVEVREHQLTEASAEVKYWRDELTLYREGHHPDYLQS